MPTTALRTPADILGAAAGLLGFAPTNSIVAYMLRRDPNDDLLVARRASVRRHDHHRTSNEVPRHVQPAGGRQRTPRFCSRCATNRTTGTPPAILDALRDALDHRRHPRHPPNHDPQRHR